MTVNQHPHPVLDPDQSGQQLPALVHIGFLDHESRLPVGAIRDERIIGGEFIFDASGFKDPFDPQHFLNLVLYGQAVLEIQGGHRPDGQLAIFLMLHDTGTKFRSQLRILFQTVKVATCQFFHSLNTG